MALTQQDNIDIQRQQNSVLNINAVTYYFEKLRPALMDFNKTYHTDRELNRTIIEVMNRADSAAARNQYSLLAESYVNLLSNIQDRSYFTQESIRFAPEEEKEAIKDLIVKFNDLSMILKYEKEEEPEEPKIRERLNYNPPNGGYQGYNLDDISNRGPKPNKERIPNPVNEDVKYAY